MRVRKIHFSMHGWRSVVEDYGKESIDESEMSIPSSPTSDEWVRLF